MLQIRSFTIVGLHNQSHTISIRLKDNTVILVGENGSGKTTVLRCFFYTLTQQWSELLRFRFISISVDIAHEIFEITYREIEEFLIKISREFSYFPSPLSKKLVFILSRNIGLNTNELERYSDIFNVPRHMLVDVKERLLRHDEVFKKFNKINAYFNKNFNFCILYLPTYRRIEQELSTIFKELDDSSIKKLNASSFQGNGTCFLELVEFGMKDVSKFIDETLSALNNFARENLNSLTSIYLADIVDKKYYDQESVNSIKSLSKAAINSVLSRIDNKIMSNQNKNKLIETISKLDRSSSNLSEQEKIIYHYFIKLINFQNDLYKKEQNILKFCDVCNKYLVNKEMKYNQQEFKLEILCKTPYHSKNNGRNIQLQNLSSGEKQIVSIFSHLFLSNRDKHFIIIDEPELSLSVEWQKNILVDIHNSTTCCGIFAVTHSPFIFDNELMPYARGINSLGSCNV